MIFLKVNSKSGNILDDIEELPSIVDGLFERSWFILIVEQMFSRANQVRAGMPSGVPTDDSVKSCARNARVVSSIDHRLHEQ